MLDAEGYKVHVEDDQRYQLSKWNKDHEGEVPLDVGVDIIFELNNENDHKSNNDDESNNNK